MRAAKPAVAQRDRQAQRRRRRPRQRGRRPARPARVRARPTSAAELRRRRRGDGLRAPRRRGSTRTSPSSAQDGGIVEERIVGVELRSPSVQLRVTPLGEVELLSTHDQLLGGPSGQTLPGLPLPRRLRLRARDHARGGQDRRRGSRSEGVLGRFAVDFVVVRDGRRTRGRRTRSSSTCARAGRRTRSSRSSSSPTAPTTPTPRCSPRRAGARSTSWPPTTSSTTCCAA